MSAFRERVLEKLRADLGSLMPEEALAGLVQQAVQDQFFKERRIPQGNYSADRVEPSWFVAEVAKLTTPMIREQVLAWVAGNKPLLEETIKKFLADESLLLLAIAAMREATTQQIFEAANAFYTATKRGY
jgi:hypothetical protein